MDQGVAPFPGLFFEGWKPRRGQVLETYPIPEKSQLKAQLVGEGRHFPFEAVCGGFALRMVNEQRPLSQPDLGFWLIFPKTQGAFQS